MVDLDERVDELTAELSELVAHLKEIEWAGEIQGDECCPACVGRKPYAGGIPVTWLAEIRAAYGHKPDCWLARAIGGDHA
jgi:hypothetical protein